MGRLKVLVAGDPGSIHATRFVNLLQEIGYDVRVFQSEHYYSQEEHLHDTTVYVSDFDVSTPVQPPRRGNRLVALSPRPVAYESWPGRHIRGPRRLLRAARRRLLGGRGGYVPAGDLPRRAVHLRRVLEEWKPEVVFSLKMQNDGYVVAEALASAAGRKPRWVHFTWGTDLEFFGRHPDHAPAHLPRIREALGACPYLLSDCRRDQLQAREFGFRGELLGVCVAPGGFDLDEIAALRAAAGTERRTILVKGRDGGLVGRAMVVMQAFDRLGPALKGWPIRIMMASGPVRAAAEALKRRHGLDCEVLPRLSYRELLLCFGRSRLAVAASDVDGTPGFLMEALAMGAFPVHSDMASIREWIEDGVNGLLFRVDDTEALGAAILRGLRDDALLAAAGERNRELTRERLDRARHRAMVKRLVEERVLP